MPGTIAIALALAVLATQTAQTLPDDLARMAASARLAAPIVGWCSGQFQSGRKSAYAVAESSSTDGGRYLVLEADAAVVELAPFTGRPDLACYTPARARALNSSIGQSGIIHGKIEPRWPTTVICAFVDDTSAVCWQYAPGERRFVRVGQWIT